MEPEPPGWTVTVKLTRHLGLQLKPNFFVYTRNKTSSKLLNNAVYVTFLSWTHTGEVCGA